MFKTSKTAENEERTHLMTSIDGYMK